MASIEIEPFPQNDPNGCIPACLANTARYLLHEDIFPQDVDDELNRKPNTDFLIYDRATWLLRKGLKIENYGTFNKSSLDLEQYFRDETQLKELLPGYADDYFAGNVRAAERHFNSDEFHEYFARLKEGFPTYIEELASYSKLGKFIEHQRPIQLLELKQALQIGKVALITPISQSNIAHQELLLSDDVWGESAKLYSPGEKTGRIEMVQTNKMYYEYIDRDEVLIVSKQ